MKCYEEKRIAINGGWAVVLCVAGAIFAVPKKKSVLRRVEPTVYFDVEDTATRSLCKDAAKMMKLHSPVYRENLDYTIPETTISKST